MSESTAEQIVLEQAHKDLQDILHLKANPPFERYFMRKINAKILALSEDLLNNDELSESESAKKRIERKTLISIRDMLVQDEAGNRSILEQDKGNPIPRG